jgi:hypothetical protein
MSGWLLVGIGVLAGGTVVAAWVHHGYSWRNYRATVAAVPPARRSWISRLGQLAAVLAIAALAIGLLYLLATGPQHAN